MHISKVTMSRAAEATKITWQGFFVNLFLAIIKMIAGVLGTSSAMIADAFHSISDFITDLVVLTSFKIVNKPADKNHNYGHGKFETLASLFIAVALLLAAGGIGYNAVENVLAALDGKQLARPGYIALIAAVVSIVVKEILYQYQVKVGKRLNSGALVANAWHHRSDALSSGASLIGIGGAIFLGDRWRMLDPVAALLVAVMLAFVAYQIAHQSIRELLEEAISEEDIDVIRDMASSVEGVENPHQIRTRKIGSYSAIEMHIELDAHMTVERSHNIVVAVEELLYARYGRESIVTIHVDPK